VRPPDEDTDAATAQRKDALNDRPLIEGYKLTL
jgi:hypothetical protein